MRMLHEMATVELAVVSGPGSLQDRRSKDLRHKHRYCGSALHYDYIPQ